MDAGTLRIAVLTVVLGHGLVLSGIGKPARSIGAANGAGFSSG
jgi:hypothetical protein